MLELQDGKSVNTITQTNDLLARILSRQPAEITDILRSARIGIAGLGGLGSVVAENLARCGVGALVLADFDVIEPSNLNRQRYRLEQIGRTKVDALIENLKSYVPFTNLIGHQAKVDADNCADIFQNCDIVAECFDNPESKAALVTGLRRHFPERPIVAASGLAGLGPVNNLKVEKRMGHVYVIGDQRTDARDGAGLFAARVGIVASMQAHLIVQLLVSGNPAGVA